MSALKAKKGPKSIKLYWRVIREAGLSMSALGFLCVLKTFRGGLGIIPSAETLAETAGIDRKTVFRYLKELKEAKVIRIVRRVVEGKQTSNCYLLDDEQLACLLSQNAISPSGKNGTRPLRPQKGDTSTIEVDRVCESPEESDVQPPNVIQYPTARVARKRSAQ